MRVYFYKYKKKLKNDVNLILLVNKVFSNDLKFRYLIKISLMRSVFIPVTIILFIFCGCKTEDKRIIMTVKGEISADQAGIILTHEHILVDFTEADSSDNRRWNREEVMTKAMPFLKEAKQLGCKTFIDCTPAYLGRDPILLRLISDSTGLNIVTNTGLYGVSGNKFMPAYVWTESVDELAARWVDEWENGIEDSGIRPGFIKIGVEGDRLSELHRKIVRAAARTHLLTGMTIVSHTGPAALAFEQIKILGEEHVSPEAFVWVHAQSETDVSNHFKAASQGAWISLDGVDDDNAAEYLPIIKSLRENNLLNKVLLSQDAGWYEPGKENGGNFRGYTSIFLKLVPLLEKNGFSKKEIRLMLAKNPADAFAVRVRRIKE
jgi:phosphotriesterase-related protein